MAIATTSAANIASGSFSGGGSWTLSDGGELYVDVVTIPGYRVLYFGEGFNEFYVVHGRMMWSHGITLAPWGDYKDKIYTIRFSSNVKRDSKSPAL